MSFYGTHPQRQRTRQGARRALPGGCWYCRYMWRCGRDFFRCPRCTRLFCDRRGGQ